MAPQDITPKLENFMKWKKISQVNKMLDAGDLPAKIHDWVNKNGFKISPPLVYRYAKLYRQSKLASMTMEKLVSPFDPDLAKNIEMIRATQKIAEVAGGDDKVRTEMDALDYLIQRGYSTLKQYKDLPITPNTMMKAIELKNKITEGSHEGYTSYGLESLRKLEHGKYQIVLSTLMEFVPKDKREEAIEAIERTEDEYYKGTEFYEEYLSSKEQYIDGLQRVGKGVQDDN